MRRTPLYERHIAAGARMVPFAGWQMPLHYGSQIEEHHAVRERAGLFDVSHMRVADFEPGLAPALRTLFAFDVGRLAPGQAQYGCLLNEHGGIIDDLILYHRGDAGFRVVSNAGTRGRVAEQYAALLPASGWILREDVAILALQGPAAAGIMAALLGREVDRWRPFTGQSQPGESEPWWLGRTGYTGEDGFEIILPAAEAEGLWQRAVVAGAVPAGLGARDTLRLEAGLNLYGADMDESTLPAQVRLGWTVHLDDPARTFVGRQALVTVTPITHQCGLMLQAPGVMRAGQHVRFADGAEGRITSGGWSPVLSRSIALAQVPDAADGACEVSVRGRWLPALKVKPPFLRRAPQPPTPMSA